MKQTLFTFALLFSCNLLALQAQVDLRNLFIEGKVMDQTTGKGIPGVPVSDGYLIVQTNDEGNYQIVTNRTADFIMLTIPSGYEIPMKNGLADIGIPIDKTKENQQIDFALKPLNRAEDNHRLIVFADPQVYDENDLQKFEESVKDMIRTIQEEDVPTYAFVCGDIVFDKPELFAPYKEIVTRLACPVFHTKGNHDMAYGGWSAETSPTIFRKEFGPEFYSFNRGNTHYVVLDDVMYTSNAYYYIGYLSDRQMNWLKQDLSFVKPGSNVILMFHIPVWSLELKENPSAMGSLFNCLQNREHLFELLKPFNAHIFSGHNHSNENYILATNIFEHIHGGICGSWWQSDICTDGTPAGYAVYNIQDDQIDWHYRTTGKEAGYQATWYAAGTDPERPEAVIANVWNWDPAWEVVWYENGELKGKMEQYKGVDPYYKPYFEQNRANWIHTWISVTPTDHLFYAIPSHPGATITIEVTDRFGKKYKAIQLK